MSDSPSSNERCVHNPYDAGNTLTVESHWGAGSRIRCTVCGGCAAIAKNGAIVPETCDCHRASDQTGLVPHTAKELADNLRSHAIDLEEERGKGLRFIADIRRAADALEAMSADETTDDLAHIAGDIHEAVGEDRDSDHATLPVRIRQVLADLRNEINALEPQQRNVYTAMDYVGIGPLPNCDVCKQPYAAHDQTTYSCPA